MYELCRWALVRLWCDDRAQDLVEYSLLAAFVAVAAAAAFPNSVEAISIIFSRIRSLTAIAAT